jgi:hypothetical protein
LLKVNKSLLLLLVHANVSLHFMIYIYDLGSWVLTKDIWYLTELQTNLRCHDLNWSNCTEAEQINTPRSKKLGFKVLPASK